MSASLPNCCLASPAAGKHTANSHHLSALVTPAGMSYECQAQQTISLASSDPQKTVTMILSAVHIQPFDIISDFVFSEGRLGWCWERERGLILKRAEKRGLLGSQDGGACVSSRLRWQFSQAVIRFLKYHPCPSPCFFTLLLTLMGENT